MLALEGLILLIPLHVGLLVTHESLGTVAAGVPATPPHGVDTATRVVLVLRRLQMTELELLLEVVEVIIIILW